MREYTGSRTQASLPVRPAGLQPAASCNSEAQAFFRDSGVQLRWAHRLTARVPLWLRANEFLETRIAANRIPFPTML